MVPIQATRQLGAEFVIAIAVRSRKRKMREIQNGLQLLTRCNYITSDRLNLLQLEKADYVIAPPVKNVHWANFRVARRVIVRGEQAAQKHLDEIQKLLRKQERRSWLWPW